ncbi:hypothetical protein KFE25_012493 [Diacronema lutheri]|uniref:Uncharacterized protein n=1 Tax=Diacronema lutheri TaxID=2081491 RepID=A0A8J5XTG4_DIALT|nr:hypothetical protein KFE25_012493 [Diacronema lutheri]
MTDPTWEDTWANASKAAAPAPLVCADAACEAALVCAECKTALVLKAHMLEERIEQGDGAGWSYDLELFDRDYTCYQVVEDGGPNAATRERVDLVLAVKEDAQLPSKDGWIDNPKALGQSLQLSEAVGWPGKTPDLDLAWFKGYTRRAAHCSQCKADVAFLFEPDAIFFLTYVATDVAGKGNGNAFGMVPFWGLRLTQVRPRFASPGAPAAARSSDDDDALNGDARTEGARVSGSPPPPLAGAASAAQREAPAQETGPALDDNEHVRDSRPAPAPPASPLPVARPISDDVRRQLLSSGLLPRLAAP